MLHWNATYLCKLKYVNEVRRFMHFCFGRIWFNCFLFSSFFFLSFSLSRRYYFSPSVFFARWFLFSPMLILLLFIFLGTSPLSLLFEFNSHNLGKWIPHVLVHRCSFVQVHKHLMLKMCECKFICKWRFVFECASRLLFIYFFQFFVSLAFLNEWTMVLPSAKTVWLWISVCTNIAFCTKWILMKNGWSLFVLMSPADIFRLVCCCFFSVWFWTHAFTSSLSSYARYLSKVVNFIN